MIRFCISITHFLNKVLINLTFAKVCGKLNNATRDSGASDDWTISARLRALKKILMRITVHDDGVPFNLDDDNISQLETYRLISKGTDGMCDIANLLCKSC